jgi:hypothetical protein
LAAVIAAAAIAWSAWWWIQATARDQALTVWLTDRREAGWVAEAEDMRVTGFPNRVDSIVTNLELADPRAGWAWHADEFQTLSLSYKPNHIIAVLPGEQIVSTRYETLHMNADNLRGSVIFRPTPRLELDHMTFEIGDMEITSDSGWTAGIGEAIFATRQTAGTPFAHDVAFNAKDLAVPRRLAEAVQADGVLPAAISAVTLDTTLRFDRPWDRTTIEGENPVLEGVDIRDVSITWGKLDLRGRGDLSIDVEGFAEGRIDLRARNWRDMISLAETAGAIDPTLAGALRSGLDLIARLGGDRNALDVPLDFSNGVARIGPVPIGPAPRLANR